jgi:hypothetical protein
MKGGENVRTLLVVVTVSLLMCLNASVKAQEEGEEESGRNEVVGDRGEGGGSEGGEKTFTINGSIKMQVGVFTPLLSNVFKPFKNEAFNYKVVGAQKWTRTAQQCDPIMKQFPCIPNDHGQTPGNLSMARATLQLEGDWKPNNWINIHAILRGTRSLETPADGYAQPDIYPYDLSPAGAVADANLWPRPEYNSFLRQRKERAREFVLNHFYNTAELREFYVDAFLTNWLSFRIGRQQVTWGETGQFRLLDVINPVDGSWHFGPVESFKDTRVPLWIVKALVEFPSIDHDLEIVWVPMLDKPENLVSTLASQYGAWGVPYTNDPAGFTIDNKYFLFPRNTVENSRIGFRWKGSIGSQFSYSLVYYYTHQFAAIPLYYDLKPLPGGGFNSSQLQDIYIGFPRQHIAGFSADYTLEYPIGGVLRVEAAIEPNRTIPVNTAASQYKNMDPNNPLRYYFDNPQKLVLSYAVVYTRPTIIRFLNPTANITFNLQFMHTVIPDLSDVEKQLLVEAPGYNSYTIKQHSMTVSVAAFTSYLNGFINPKVIVAVLPPYKEGYGLSGFVSAEVGFRFGDYWRVNLLVLDIFGTNAYKDLGLLRDRSEVNMSVLCQF